MADSLPTALIHKIKFLPKQKPEYNPKSQTPEINYSSLKIL
jgi:hypothetical protein